MNKKLFLPLFIIVFILGCGAQNTPNETEDDLTQQIVDTRILPTIIDIPFPQTLLTDISNDLFLQIDIKEIENISSEIKEQLNILEPIMPRILKECDHNSSCFFPEHHFSNTLGAINFFNLEEKSGFKQELFLSVDEFTKLNIKWNETKTKVVSNYSNDDYNVNLKYQTFNNHETLIVSNQALEKRSDYFIQKFSTSYLLKSNYINKNNFNFSTKIKITDNVVEERNKDIFTFNNLNKKLAEGSYFVLPPRELKDFTLMELISQHIGMVTAYQEEIQGFTSQAGLDYKPDELIFVPMD